MNHKIKVIFSFLLILLSLSLSAQTTDDIERYILGCSIFTSYRVGSCTHEDLNNYKEVQWKNRLFYIKKIRTSYLKCDGRKTHENRFTDELTIPFTSSAIEVIEKEDRLAALGQYNGIVDLQCKDGLRCVKVVTDGEDQIGGYYQQLTLPACNQNVQKKMAAGFRAILK